MNAFDKAVADLEKQVSPPASRVEKICWLIVGLLVGYFLPVALSYLLFKGLHFAGVNLPAWQLSVFLFSHLMCVPLAWWFWRKKYFGIGVLIPSLIQLLMVVFAFGLWQAVRLGSG